MAYSERYFRRRPQVIKQVNLNAVGRENSSGYFSKLTAIIAAIVSDYNRNAPFTPSKTFIQIIGQPLRSGSYRVDVHTVASGTHDATQTSSAEFEVFIEAIH